MNAYQHLLRPLLFTQDAERAHDLTFALLEKMPWLAWPVGMHGREYNPITLWGGTELPNPIGLAAGLDKNARLLRVWQTLGFGFVEVGTITPRPQAGNPKPRLFRLPADQALINRMGFNNEGVAAVAKRLEKRPKKLVVGANIGKNKDTPNEQAVQDYILCFEQLYDLADYFVVNVSSPNTPGLRALQDRDSLQHILGALQARNPKGKPLYVKIAPDLSPDQVQDVVSVYQATGLAGVVATNTTLSREGLHTPAATIETIGAGGLSGAPIWPHSHRVLTQLTQAKVPVIAVGGIAQGSDAKYWLDHGAHLVQVYTGFIYRGPQLLQDIRNSILYEEVSYA